MRPFGLLVLALLLAASTASAAPLRAAESDGVRYVAWDASGGRTVIHDDVAGERRTVARPKGCVLGGVGSGRLVWTCGGASLLKGTVLDLVTGVRTDLPEQRLQGDGHAGYVAVGRVWVAREFHSYRNSGLLSYVHVASGENRPGPEQARVAVDLDAEDLSRPLCAPLRRTEWSSVSEATPPFYPYRFDGRFGGESADYDGVVIQRCGSRRRQKGACFAECREVSFGARRVAWHRSRRAVAVYDDRTRRISCRPVRVDRGRSLGAVAHTRRRLWLTTSRGGRLTVAPVAFPRRRC